MTPMAERILKLVTERRTVSFAEPDHIEGFSGGTLEMIVNNDRVSNVVLWQRMTREGVDAINELRATGKIHEEGTVALTYYIDGCAPRLPIAKSRRHYKTPHWAPVVFNPGPRHD